MELRLTAIWFLGRLALGTVAFTFCFVSKEIRRSFHRFNFISAAILWLLVAWLGWGLSYQSSDLVVFGAVLCAGIATVYAGRAMKGENWNPNIIYTVGNITVLILYTASPFTTAKLIITPRYFFLANVASGSFLLGATTVAMILGHWYLIMRNLSFEHLVKASKLFLWAIISRTVWTAIEFAIVSAPIREQWLGPDAMFVLMRVAWGLAMPLVLAFFVLRLAKTKNNQAATGMLYVCEFCVLGGEAIAAYLRM